MPKIELYAELLTYIRTVTIVASLQTETDDETRIELLSDNQTITISHHGVSASLRLPTRMIGGGTAAITLPPRPSKDLTLRLKVEETAPGFLSLEHSDENIVPWPASALHDAKRLQCKECAASIVDVDQIHEWRDLPNENWAEMMDFWHCHKPHEHEHEGLEHDQGGTTAAVDGKGYSASNKLSAQPGIGYIGLSYFLLAEEDCRNVKIDEAVDAPSLLCASCNHALGIVDPAIGGWKLYKWSLSLAKADLTNESFSVSKWISTQLLAAVDNSGVRRFVVEPADRKDGKSDGLHIWLFTDSLSFSSSHLFFTRTDPTRAMKILWKPTEDAPKIMEDQHFSHEHLVFPTHVYLSLKQTLESSQFLLPESARKMKDWNVGLLQRFDWDDVSGSDATVLPASKVQAPQKEEGEADAAATQENAEDAIRKIYGSEALLE